MATYKPHISKEKAALVKELSDAAKNHSIIAIVNMESLPAQQLQKMRAQLREKVVLKMAKARLIKIALEKSGKKDIAQLFEKMRGMPAVLFTNDNPFTLFKTLKQNKSSAPAKGGQIAPSDITVPAGPTPFAPGPVIGELGAFGIKSGVANGKIEIKEDCVVLKEGEEIPAALAGLLTRLGIEPMEIGLDLIAAYEDGVIYDKKTLDVDEDKFVADITQAHSWAFNLAMDTAYLTAETTEPMLVKAFNDAKALALEQGILTSATVGGILSKAECQANALKSEANI